MATLANAATESSPGSFRLPGGPVVWVYIVLEFLTFALFMASAAYHMSAEPEVFRSGATHLHPMSAAINTGVLLTGSWMAARGVLARRAGKAEGPWLAAAGVAGLLFLGIKTWEYSTLAGMGLTLSTNSFWFYYLFLTSMHYLHVLGGVGFLFAAAVMSRRPGPEHEMWVEAAAAFWHMVDVVWIFLFPLLYLVHP